MFTKNNPTKTRGIPRGTVGASSPGPRQTGEVLVVAVRVDLIEKTLWRALQGVEALWGNLQTFSKPHYLPLSDWRLGLFSSPSFKKRYTGEFS